MLLRRGPRVVSRGASVRPSAGGAPRLRPYAVRRSPQTHSAGDDTGCRLPDHVIMRPPQRSGRITRPVHWCAEHRGRALVAALAALVVVVGMSSALGARTIAARSGDAAPVALSRPHRPAPPVSPAPAATSPSLGTLDWVQFAAALVLLLLAFGSILAAGLPW